MTISNSGTPARAAGNGVTTVFNFSFEVFASTDLVVRDILDSTGVPTTKTLTTDYSVALSATSEGGTVTFLVAPAVGHTIDIRSVIPLQQPTSIRNQGPFHPEIHEAVFDRLERQIQDTRRLGALAMRLPDSELPTTDWDTIFDLASRKGKYGVFFNATTGAPELYASIGATALSQSIIGAFLYPRNAAEITAGVTPTNYFIFYGDVRRYGAICDGVTDDSAALAKAALVFAQGIPVIFPPLQMMVSSQVTFTVPATRRGLIIGYGCEIFTTGAISAIRLSGRSDPHGVTVAGITVNQRNNTLATYGFEAVGTNSARFVDCVVEANNCQANYGGFIARNTTPSDSNTGAILTTFDNCAVRERAGADPGVIPNGIILQGACNGSNVIRCALVSPTTGVLITPESGQTYIPNGVLIDDSDFEGLTTAILMTADAANPVSGLRITNNRVENLTTFVSMTGATAQPAVPVYMAGNYLISSVGTYLNNPNTLYVNNYNDCSITPNLSTGKTRVDSQGLRSVPLAAGNHAFEGFASGNATGYTLRDNNGVIRGRWVFNTAPVGTRLQGINAIAQSDTLRHNLAGTATFAAATTKVVVFANNEPDANYRVVITFTADPGAVRWWVSGKGTTGFTVNVSAATSASFDWAIIGD